MRYALNFVFFFLPSTVNTGLNVYRNKNALSHFVIAGGKTFLFIFQSQIWFRKHVRTYKSWLLNS